MLCPKERKPAEYYKWMYLNDNCCRMVQCNRYAIKSESKFLLHTERSDRNKRERGTNECNVNELCLEEFTFFFCLTVVVFKYFCVWHFGCILLYTSTPWHRCFVWWSGHDFVQLCQLEADCVLCDSVMIGRQNCVAFPLLCCCCCNPERIEMPESCLSFYLFVLFAVV